MILTYVLIILQ